MYLTDALLTNILHTISPQQSLTDINVLLSYLANYIFHMESDYRWPTGLLLHKNELIKSYTMYKYRRYA